MKYAVQMGSGTTLYISSFTDLFRHSKFNRGGSQTHRQHGDRKSLLSFLQNKECKPNKNTVVSLYIILLFR
jgi:hypothetical protein